MRIVDKKQEGYAITLQKWKGVVKNISEDSFIAHITDLIENIPEEEVELFYSDIQEDPDFRYKFQKSKNTLLYCKVL